MHAEPSPTLSALADGIDAVLRDLASRPGFQGGDPPLIRVVRSMQLLAVAVRRMAVSGPEAERYVERLFPDHPDGPPPPDRYTQSRAHLDMISFLTVGDMLLDDLAAAWLRMNDVEVGRVPWQTFMGHVDLEAAMHDGSDGLVMHARNLDLLLREARNRIVAHREQDHAPAFSWQQDGSMQVVYIGDADRSEPLRLLCDVNRTLPLPTRDEHDYLALRDWVFAFAPELDAVARKKVHDALRLAGYDTYPPGRIVEHALALVRFVYPSESG